MGNCVKSNLNNKNEEITLDIIHNKIKLLEEEKKNFNYKISELYNEYNNFNTKILDIYKKIDNDYVNSTKQNNIIITKEELINTANPLFITSPDCELPAPFILESPHFDINVSFTINYISKKILILKLSYNLYYITQTKHNYSFTQPGAIYFDKNYTNHVFKYCNSYHILLNLVYNNIFILTDDFDIISTSRNITTTDINNDLKKIPEIYKKNIIKTTNKILAITSGYSKNYLYLDNTICNIIKNKLKK